MSVTIKITCKVAVGVGIFALGIACGSKLDVESAKEVLNHMIDAGKEVAIAYK
ncbi:hypothetical protein SAMN02745111_01692 [Eubacterium uniforme]|uniref:Uncharacterized protein n=1 Tax=Eubacterium uniforme TaxID=39495 RepID=A0A1T4VVC3_9FIRM|nr:hypothetical protein [Eubacterium uniforme]SKA68942.1 hypothetical protein SAMN02745111_01692 [Eubacterium uniforme]